MSSDRITLSIETNSTGSSTSPSNPSQPIPPVANTSGAGEFGSPEHVSDFLSSFWKEATGRDPRAYTNPTPPGGQPSPGSIGGDKPPPPPPRPTPTPGDDDPYYAQRQAAQTWIDSIGYDPQAASRPWATQETTPAPPTTGEAESAAGYLEQMFGSEVSGGIHSALGIDALVGKMAEMVGVEMSAASLAMLTGVGELAIATSIANNIGTAMFDSSIRSIIPAIGGQYGDTSLTQSYLGSTSNAVQMTDPWEEITGGWLNLNPLDDILQSLIETTSGVIDQFDKLATSIDKFNYSPEVEAAAQNAEYLRQETAMYEAEVLGGETAEYIRLQSEINSNFQEIRIMLSDILLPAVNEGLSLFRDALSWLKTIATALTSIFNMVTGAIANTTLGLLVSMALDFFHWVTSLKERIEAWLNIGKKTDSIAAKARAFIDTKSYDPTASLPEKKRKR